MTSDTFTTEIHSLSYGGRGVGRRQDGKVAFVPFVMPGEIVRARVEREHASYCLASAVEIIRPSPHRVGPECPLFTQCGGCDWQHLPYGEQVRWKNLILEQEVARADRSRPVAADAPVPSGRAYGYRGHTVLQCHGQTLGFFMKKTNRVIPADACPVLTARLQKLIFDLSRILKQTRGHAVHSLELHAPGDEVLLEARCGSGSGKAHRRFMEMAHRDLGISGVSLVSPGGREVLGEKTCSCTVEVRGETVHLASSFGEFIQANMQVNRDLVTHVTHLAEGSAFIVDLYAGSGNFSIPLAGVAERVLAVEWSRGLVSRGRLNARWNGRDNVEFREMDAVRALAELKGGLEGGGTLVVDPPREGAKEAAGLIPQTGACRVVYVSCNPTTLARDLKPLLQAGYALRGLRLFDMFPQTFHLESVAFLEREPLSGSPGGG